MASALPHAQGAFIPAGAQLAVQDVLNHRHDDLATKLGVVRNSVGVDALSLNRVSLQVPWATGGKRVAIVPGDRKDGLLILLSGAAGHHCAGVEVKNHGGVVVVLAN